MAALSPWAVDAFQDTENLFDLLLERISLSHLEDNERLKLHHIATSLGVTDQELFDRLTSGNDKGLTEAHSCWQRMLAHRWVKVLVLACQRYWAWGATDLARLRVTSAMGCLRLEAEAAGLTSLFLRQPELAERWSRIGSEQEGRRFYRDTQPCVKQVLGKLRLGGAYDIASAASHHVRMVSVARSLVSKPNKLRLPDQEFDPDDPFSFHLALAYFHRMQSRVLGALGRLIPGVADAEWNAAFDEHSAKVDALWKTLQAKYPDHVKECAQQA
jgi:hypothetical protein